MNMKLTAPILLMMLISTILALLAMAFYTLMERKFLGYCQIRKGPNKVMLSGIPQPFADAIKLFAKERSTPSTANTLLFYLAPGLALTLSILLWLTFPHQTSSIFMSFGILYFLCVSSMNVYTTFISGWCANSKYALLGSLRGIAQTISYEVSMALILLMSLITMKSMDMHQMSSLLLTPLSFMFMPIMLMWFITNLAETNRSPFDLAEGESELVSGFNTEYSGGLFALIFMAEYANILFMSLLTTLIFMGSTQMMAPTLLIIKTMALATLFLWARATLPRMRYDNLMYLTWKSFLPITLTSLMLLSLMMY